MTVDIEHTSVCVMLITVVTVFLSVDPRARSSPRFRYLSGYVDFHHAASEMNFIV